jgi:hemerythrin
MRDYEECRPYIDHLQVEHRRLHHMIQQARAAVIQNSSPDRDATVADILRILRNMRQELAHHFTEEEAGGCMDEAVSHCPRLAAEVERIEAEHPDLLAQLDGLIVEAADLDKSVKHRVAFENAFDNLCRQIHAHEAAENSILRQGFGSNVNGEENGAPAAIVGE